MLFKVPNMLCSDSQHQAYYAHHFVAIMLIVISILQTLYVTIHLETCSL